MFYLVIYSFLSELGQSELTTELLQFTSKLLKPVSKNLSQLYFYLEPDRIQIFYQHNVKPLQILYSNGPFIS